METYTLYSYIWGILPKHTKLANWPTNTTSTNDTRTETNQLRIVRLQWPYPNGRSDPTGESTGTEHSARRPGDAHQGRTLVASMVGDI